MIIPIAKTLTAIVQFLVHHERYKAPWKWIKDTDIDATKDYESNGIKLESIEPFNCVNFCPKQCQPNSRARRSHNAVSFFSFQIAPSDFSLASSQVSVAALHFSASRWYWVVCLFASTRVAFMWWLCSSATTCCSFSSSIRRSTNCLSISLIRSGSFVPHAAIFHYGLFSLSTSYPDNRQQ